MADAGEVGAAGGSDGEADVAARAAYRDSSFSLNFPALSWIIIYIYIFDLKTIYVYIFLLILHDIRNLLIWLALFQITLL